MTEYDRNTDTGYDDESGNDVQQLSMFESRAVTELQFGASGTITAPDAQPPRMLHHGERLTTVTVWTVEAVNFPHGKVDLARVHKARAAEVHELSPDIAAQLLGECRLNTRREYEAKLGL